MKTTHQKVKTTVFPFVLPLALLFCLLAVAMSGAVAGETADSDSSVFGEPAHHVVIQVSTSDPQVQHVALNNAVNLQKRFGMDNVAIEIVSYGPGLSLMTKDSEYPERVTSMAKKGIRFSACHNTMEGIKRKTGHMPELLDGVEVVPSGTARIVILEEQGYAYVRP